MNIGYPFLPISMVGILQKFLATPNGQRLLSSFPFQPTGQVTGLGLSLSYDIVKAHGGELKVETKEGEGTEFIIQLPNELMLMP